MTIKQKFVDEARSWIGTKFHHQGRLKKSARHDGGCDCIGLIVGCMRDLKIPSKIVVNGENKLLCDFDQGGYAKIPDGEMLFKALKNCMDEVDLGSAKIGDIALFKFEHMPQHVAIISDYDEQNLGLIHCYMQSGRVIEHMFDDGWKDRLVNVFRF